MYNVDSDSVESDLSDCCEKEYSSSSSSWSLPATPVQPKSFGIWPKAAFDEDNGKPLSEVFKKFSNVQPKRSDNVPYDINGLSVIVVPLKKVARK